MFPSHLPASLLAQFCMANSLSYTLAFWQAAICAWLGEADAIVRSWRVFHFDSEECLWHVRLRITKPMTQDDDPYADRMIRGPAGEFYTERRRFEASRLRTVAT